MASKRKRSRNSKTARQLAAERRKLETPEQRALRLEKNRVRTAIRRACESEEDRANRLARDRARTQATRSNLKKKARAATLQLNMIKHASQNSSPEENSLNITSLNKRLKSSYESYLLLEAQRAAAAKNAAERRSHETLEQRAIRLEKCRIRSAVLRACESEEMRAVRLARQRIRTRDARLKQQLNGTIFYPSNSLNQENPLVVHCKNKTDTACRVWAEQLNTVYLHQMIQQRAYMILQSALAQQQMALESSSDIKTSSQWSEFETLSSSGVDVECEVTIEVEEENYQTDVCQEGEVKEKRKDMFSSSSKELLQISDISNST